MSLDHESWLLRVYSYIYIGAILTIVVFFLVGVVCPDLENPENGVVSLSNETVFGSQATYTCNDGLVLSPGDDTRTCEANGQWSGTDPTCGRQPINRVKAHLSPCCMSKAFSNL